MTITELAGKLDTAIAEVNRTKAEFDKKTAEVTAASMANQNALSDVTNLRSQMEAELDKVSSKSFSATRVRQSA